ncbi:MAG: efflux RND transporter periplasmic adaptor subunit [Candidatus Krumholzibacteriia bacterium]
MKTMTNTGSLLLLLLLLLPVLVGCGDDGPALPSGTFEAVEVDVSPRLAGQLLRVGPREGTDVTAGDTLLVVDTALLSLQRVEAEAGLAAVAARRRAAEADAAQARRALELAELSLARLDAMHRAGSATAQQQDVALAERDIQARRVAAAGHGVAAMDAEAARLVAALAVLDRQIADGVVLAPADGTVLLRTAEPGEMAAPGQPALRLADLRHLELRFYLEAPDLGLVALGRELPLQVDAFPGRSFTGTVTWISREAEFTPKNAQTRDARAQLVYAVKLRVANPDGDLAVGMAADVVVGR